MYKTVSGRRRRVYAEEELLGKPIEVADFQQTAKMNEPGVYDFGFEIDTTRLPPGPICIILGGPDAGQIAKGEQLGEGPIRLELSCFRVWSNTCEKRRHQLDRRWRLTLGIDGPPKLLIVEKEKELALWCAHCQTLLGGVSYQCKTCDDVSVCRRCRRALSKDESHDQTHEWECIDYSYV
jgi:hypothetical protein